MSRLPIRVRLTAVFAAALVVVLAGAASFVYLRLKADLDESVRSSLAARADAVAVLARQHSPADGDPGAAAVADPEEAFSQVIAAGGRVVASRGGTKRVALPHALIERATAEELQTERRVAGLEGTVRILARPLDGSPGTVVVVGQSLGDRDETLHGLLASFAIGGPVAVVIASLLGYGLATATLRPVDAMRRRASAVSLEGSGALLPLPAARDEIRDLGETLNEMLERLRASFEHERQFVADASHELRSPIAVVKTELETMLRNDHPGELDEPLRAALDETERLARLAEDLLVLARASDDALALRRERLDAPDVLAAARERFADRAGADGREVVVEAMPGLQLWADPSRLRQTIDNLIDNALRYGAGDITLSARPSGSGTEIEVADEGAGFPAAVRKRAFERFARGDDTRSGGGAGLGLAIVQAIAEAHGGRASIDGAGGGARVRVWLPGEPSQAHLSDGVQDRPQTHYRLQEGSR